MMKTAKRYVLIWNNKPVQKSDPCNRKNSFTNLNSIRWINEFCILLGVLKFIVKDNIIVECMLGNALIPNDCDIIPIDKHKLPGINSA